MLASQRPCAPPLLDIGVMLDTTYNMGVPCQSHRIIDFLTHLIGVEAWFWSSRSMYGYLDLVFVRHGIVYAKCRTTVRVQMNIPSMNWETSIRPAPIHWPSAQLLHLGCSAWQVWPHLCKLGSISPSFGSVFLKKPIFNPLTTNPRTEWFVLPLFRRWTSMKSNSTLCCLLLL